MVANQELATVRSASRMAATLRQRYGQDRLRLVLTRTDRRAEIGHEDVERAVGIDVRHTFPSDYRLALQAMNKGRPIVLDNHNELSAAFTAFARELAGDDSKRRRPQKGQPRSLFGRLIRIRARGLDGDTMATGLMSGGGGVDTRSSYYQELKSRIHQELLNRLNLDAADQDAPRGRGAGDPQADRRHGRARERRRRRSASSSAKR